MKKLLTTIILLSLLFAVGVFGEGVRPVHVTLNGNAIDCASYGQDATIVEGRTLVPLRAIFEAMGAEVFWDQSTKTVTSTLDAVSVKLTIGEKVLYKNDVATELDVPALVMNGRTMVPARAIAESFGVDVSWDKETRTVILIHDNYKRGTVSDGKYTSEWLGMSFVLSDGYEFQSEGELRRLMGLGEGVTGVETDYNSIKECYEFMALDAKGNSVQLVCVKNEEKLSAQDFLSSALEVYSLLGVQYDTSDVYDLGACGRIFKAQDVVFEVASVKLYQTNAVFEKNGRLVVLVISRTDDTALSVITSCFEK